MAWLEDDVSSGEGYEVEFGAMTSVNKLTRLVAGEVTTSPTQVLVAA
jgi:hypothetical protein